MRHCSRCALSLVALLAGCATSDSADSGVGSSAAALTQRCQHPHPAPPPLPAACLFGEVFSDIRTNRALQLGEDVWIRSTAELDALCAEQLLRAVQQSSHSDVMTAAEALSRVDEQEVRRIEVEELASGRNFVAFEYGVGDNSYGAFFERGSPEVVASVHDGDLLGCTIAAADRGE